MGVIRGQMNGQNAIEFAPMGDQDHLASLRLAHSEIDCAMLSDLRARTVLRASSHIDQPQEVLDELGRTAAMFFGDRFGDRCEFCLVTPSRTLVARRLGADGDTALLVVFAPDVDLGWARTTVAEACGYFES